ncbi:MAG: hypothetical protein ABI680_14020, partial [Chthoniobacteraceae bacterium]
MKRAAFILLLILLSLLALTVRCWNLRDVFIEGGVFFVDPDCYSRMTRARMVAEGEAFTIHHHDFENHPKGTRPHTTAPLDWLIAAGNLLVKGGLRMAGGFELLEAESLDVAGAMLPPLLGALACAALVLTLFRSDGKGARSGAVAGGLLLAVSPIVVHGTLLGRPDHQALLIPLITVALAGELRFAARPSRGAASIASIAWALACWVSLYEPLVLLCLVLFYWLIVDRGRFTSRETRVGWSVFGAIVVAALVIDGWRVSLPEISVRQAFVRWSGGIGELQRPTATSVLAWIGWLAVPAPVLLILNRSRPAILALIVLLATAALTFWHARWGYFVAVAFCASLPWVFQSLKRTWLAWIAFSIGLWPVAKAWDAQLFPDKDGEQRATIQRLENVSLRKLALRQQANAPGGFIAPWWLSPAVAYWSRQPGVAGSSHESLPGIEATARFYLADDPVAAAQVIRDRKVTCVISDDSTRVLANSAAILGVPVPVGEPLALTLDHYPAKVPPWLQRIAPPTNPGIID